MMQLVRTPVSTSAMLWMMVSILSICVALLWYFFWGGGSGGCDC